MVGLVTVTIVATILEKTMAKGCFGGGGGAGMGNKNQGFGKRKAVGSKKSVVTPKSGGIPTMSDHMTERNSRRGKKY